VQLEQIDHVGVLTEDADETSAAFETLGRPKVWDNHINEHNARVVFLEFGDVYVELLEPTGPGMVQDHYEEHGAGLEHIAYRVTDIRAAIESFREQGLEFETDGPRDGAGHSRIIYFDNDDTDDLAIELVELLPEDVRYPDA